MNIEDIWLWLIGGGTAFAVIFSILVSLICTVVPIAGVVWFIYRQRQKATIVQQASLSWRPTPGRVLKSRVEVSGGEYTSVVPRVIYEYEVRGQIYQSDQIRAGDKFWAVSSSQDAYRTVDRYPEGQDVTVFYNPANPAEATLER